MDVKGRSVLCVLCVLSVVSVVDMKASKTSSASCAFARLSSTRWRFACLSFASNSVQACNGGGVHTLR